MGSTAISSIARPAPSADLLRVLQTHALKKEPVILSNGETSDYYVDVKQAMLRPEAARVVGQLVADAAHEVKALAVGGMVMGAVPVACAAIASEGGNDLLGFFIRKERKSHGLQRYIEGPDECFRPGTRCLIVDDVVTTGSSTVDAIKRVLEAELHIAGVLSVVDRLAGGEKAIEAAADAPYRALVTIDEIYPERSDRH
ncbi:MAG TPA: orotate phosphoribosyltransferase [Solirubrobacterales bacterium]|jgi:orotate phosphoribosyltransferase